MLTYGYGFRGLVLELVYLDTATLVTREDYATLGAEVPAEDDVL